MHAVTALRHAALSEPIFQKTLSAGQGELEERSPAALATRMKYSTHRRPTCRVLAVTLTVLNPAASVRNLPGLVLSDEFRTSPRPRLLVTYLNLKFGARFASRAEF